MILHVPGHSNKSGWRAAVWFPAPGSGSSADPCKSCSSDRSSFCQAPGTAVLQVLQILGVHGGRPPAAAMTLDRFVGPLSADSSPPPLPAIVAARGCRQGVQGRVRHAKAPLRITPITSRVRGNSRVHLVYARVPWAAAWLRIPSVQGLVVTSQHTEGDPHIICDSCYCGIRVQGSTVIDLRLIVPASLLREISLACLSALEPALPFPHRACLRRHLHKISTTPTSCPRHSSCPSDHLNINIHQPQLQPSRRSGTISQPFQPTLDNISLIVSLPRPKYTATVSLTSPPRGKPILISPQNGNNDDVESLRLTAQRTLRLRTTSGPTIAPNGRDFQMLSALDLQPARPGRRRVADD